MFEFSHTSIERMEGISPKLVRLSTLALKISPIDFGIPEHGGLRTAEEQHQLFLNGKSKADGYDNLSYHQSGNALDFYAYVNGASWNHDHLAMVAAAHLQAAATFGYSLEWGGFWKSNKTINGIPYGWDMAHLQLNTEE